MLPPDASSHPKIRPDGVSIVAATTPGQLDAVRELLREYQASIGVDLCFQGFEHEVRDLPGQYSPPGGRLLLAIRGGVEVGCVAMRAIDDRRCEMKRLFVRPGYRGSGLGTMLVETILSEARAIGYAEVVLDTLPTMDEARRLYQKFGFGDIAAYDANPIPGTRYLGKSLLAVN